jgi:hypothetical protein
MVSGTKITALCEIASKQREPFNGRILKALGAEISYCKFI